MAKMQILFDGFADLAAQIDKAEGNLKQAVDEALTETQEVVQENLTTAAEIYNAKGRKGYATGKMYLAIKAVEGARWSGNIAEVGVGFDLKKAGGFHSIFVMYGTPKMKKDTKVYNAIKGVRTRKEIAEKQAEIMQKHLRFGGGQ